ncbi:GNAT family N-acetyltransferase [Actinomycetota bacterium Odt1-20B]
MRILTGPELLTHTGALRSVYADAFCAPPWNEDEHAAQAFAERLPEQVARPGFTAATAVREGHVVGFATAWTTRTPFPADRCYPQAAALLGAERTARWLCGAREIDELAVRPAAQGSGVAAALLDAVAAGAPGGRCWLLTSVRSPRALAFYRRRGWTQVTHPSPGGRGIAVFLGPCHPAAASLAAAPPL